MTFSEAKERLQKNGILILFSSFVIISYIKCILFESIIYPKIDTSFLINHLPKIVISLFIGSPILLLKKHAKWYAIIVSLIIDIWFVANFCYYRYNNSPIDALVLSMAGNLSGFENSAFIFLDLKRDILLFLLTGLLIPISLFFECKKKEVTVFICVFLSLYPLSFLSYFSVIREKQYWNFDLKINPFDFNEIFHIKEVKTDSNNEIAHSALFVNANKNSGIHLLINNLITINKISNEIKKLTPAEIEILNKQGYFSDLSEFKQYDSKLVIILVESMESWVLTKESMPNLWEYMQNNNHFYASKVVSQIRYGGSADGQMIINTGLLPLYNGAACFRYPNNVYPSLCKLSKGKSLCIVPHRLEVWNQGGMSLSYGYTENLILEGDDAMLFDELAKQIESEEYQTIQLLTISTHADFESVAWKSKFSPNKNMPIYEQNYLKSFHYVDEHLGKFLNKINSSKAFKDLTIMIVGDHTIFSKERRNEMTKYSQNHDDKYQPDAYTCAIIFSDKIDKKIRNDEVAYQMDIYPTITSLLDCGYKNYKGMGKNLLDTLPIRRDSYYNDELKYSNMIISSDFFKIDND